MYRHHKMLVMLAVAMTISLRLFAQSGPGDLPPDDVPLDGGLSLALITGIGYGVSRLKKRKQDAINNTNKENQP